MCSRDSLLQPSRPGPREDRHGKPLCAGDAERAGLGLGLLGFGTGDMAIVQARNDRVQPERVTWTELSMRMAAVGCGGELMQAGATGGMHLALMRIR